MMYPMIDSEEEMDQIEEIIQEVKAGLDEKKFLTVISGQVS